MFLQFYIEKGKSDVAQSLPHWLGFPAATGRKQKWTELRKDRQAVHSVSAVHSGQDTSPNPSKTRLYLRNAMATIIIVLLLYPTRIKMKFYQFDANTSFYSI